MKPIYMPDNLHIMNHWLDHTNHCFVCTGHCVECVDYCLDHTEYKFKILYVLPIQTTNCFPSLCNLFLFIRNINCVSCRCFCKGCGSRFEQSKLVYNFSFLFLCMLQYKLYFLMVVGKNRIVKKKHQSR